MTKGSSHFLFKVVRCVLLVLFLLGPQAAQARRGAPPPSSTFDALPIGEIPVFDLPAVDPAKLLGEEARAPRPAAEPSPLQFARPVVLDVTTESHGRWEATPAGGRLWRLRLHSKGATDLNLGFATFRLPPGGSLYLLAEGESYYEGPYTSADNEGHGELWLPVVPGGRAILEVYLPPSFEGHPKLELTHAGLGFRDLFDRSGQGAAKQGSCNIDVACPEASGWGNEIRSVATYSIGGVDMCTGTLIADVPASFRPFFLTAQHCDVDASNAASMVVYWNYHSPACGDLGGGSREDNQTGAIFRASRQDVDFALVELDDPPDPSFDVFWSGWDRSGNAPGDSVGIHHPDTDEKAISLNDDPLTVVDNCIVNVATQNTHWRVNDWEHGTTEPGSSGSGLWDSQSHLLVGTLSGGSASCSNTGGSDCYGRFSVAWNGPTDASRLRSWLDPQNNGGAMVEGDDLRVLEPTSFGDDAWFTSKSRPMAADFNGDGRTDIAYHGLCGQGDPCWRMHLSTGTTFTETHFGDDAWFSDKSRPITGDFNGDGRSDIAYHGLCGQGDPCWRVHLSTGTTFTEASFGDDAWFTKKSRPMAGDFNGDGKSDIAYHGLCGQGDPCWRVHLSTGTTFTEASFGDDAWLTAKSQPVTGDFDGDGRDDIAYHGLCGQGAECWRLHRSTGKTFTEDNFGNDAWFTDKSQQLSGDFDGDGRSDIAYHGLCGSGRPCWRVHQSRGNGFDERNYGDNAWFTGRSLHLSGDFDGNGLADIAYHGLCGSGAPCWRLHLGVAERTVPESVVDGYANGVFSVDTRGRLLRTHRQGIGPWTTEVITSWAGRLPAARLISLDNAEGGRIYGVNRAGEIVGTWKSPGGLVLARLGDQSHMQPIVPGSLVWGFQNGIFAVDILGNLTRTYWTTGIGWRSEVVQSWAGRVVSGSLVGLSHHEGGRVYGVNEEGEFVGTWKSPVGLALGSLGDQSAVGPLRPRTVAFGYANGVYAVTSSGELARAFWVAGSGWQFEKVPSWAGRILGPLSFEGTKHRGSTHGVNEEGKAVGVWQRPSGLVLVKLGDQDGNPPLVPGSLAYGFDSAILAIATSGELMRGIWQSSTGWRFTPVSSSAGPLTLGPLATRDDRTQGNVWGVDQDGELVGTARVSGTLVVTPLE